MHAENAALRRVQDRRRHQRAVDAAIGDGEGTAGHVVRRDLAVAGAVAEVGDAGLDFSKAETAGVTHHRNDKPLRRADGNPDIIVVLVDDVGAVDFGVHRWKFLKRLDRGQHEHAHEAETGAVGGLEFLPVGTAERHQRGHVDLVEGGQHRRRVLRRLQARGDDLTQLRHRHAFLAGGVFGARLLARHLLCRRGCRAPRGRRALHMGQNIRLGQPAINAGAPDGRRIQIVFLDKPAHGRRQRHVRSSGCRRWSGRGRCRCGRGR